MSHYEEFISHVARQQMPEQINGEMLRINPDRLFEPREGRAAAAPADESRYTDRANSYEPREGRAATAPADESGYADRQDSYEPRERPVAKLQPTQTQDDTESVQKGWITRTKDWVPAVTIDDDGQKQYRSWAVEILDGHQYTVKAGEDLDSVARRSLGVTGHADATKAEIKAEMKRIAELNPELSNLLKNHGHSRIKNGVTLRLAAPRVQHQSAEAVLPQYDMEPCDY